MELLLLGYFALIQAWVESSTGVHQTSVAVVLVRLDSTDVDLPIGAIITVLHHRTAIIHKQNQTEMQSKSSAVNIPGVNSNGKHI